MNTADHVAKIRSDGYTVIEHAIRADTVAQIKDGLSPWLQGKLMGRNDFEGRHSERVYALLAKSSSIAKIIEHEETLTIVDLLLPKNYLLSAALAINVHPGETPQRFHMDDSGGGFMPRPRPMMGVSTIWAFDDFTQDNGATEVVPGSHRWEEGREPCDADAIKVTMPAGSVVIFAGNLYHRGGANQADSTRLGITPQYCHPQLRQIENMVLAVPPALASGYSERIQAMLGYSIIDPGFMGFVDGRHPKHLIDAAYRGRKHRADLPS